METKACGNNDCLLRGEGTSQEHPLWDARLTGKGIQQAKDLREYLKVSDPAPSHLLPSPLPPSSRPAPPAAAPSPPSTW